MSTSVKKIKLYAGFLKVVALSYLGQQIWDGITVRDNVSNLSHVVGGLVGAGAGYMLNRRTVR